MSAIIVAALLMTELMVLTSPMASASLTPSDPIVIYGNSDLASKASLKGWAGDGSAENPYVIANLSFDAGSGTAISIAETSLFLIIKNCTISNSNCGMDIYRSSNVTIMGNTIQGVSSGEDIRLSSSNNNSIVNNNCSGYIGISLASSNNNTISNNNCSGNGEYGIYLYSSSFNDILDNNCSNDRFGIRSVESSSNNDFLNNTCNGNNQNGIWLDGSSRSTLSNNVCKGNMFHGILLEYSSNSTLTNNSCSGSFVGIRLSHTDNSTFSNNTGSNEYYGIFVEFSSNSTIINNTYRDITGESILLGMSNDSTVSNNTCIGGYLGVFVGSSDRCTVSNNTCVDISDVGIYLDNCTGYMDGNTLVNCSFSLWADPLDAQEYVDGMRITSTNTVNGLPVYFLKNADLDGASVPSFGFGEIILLNVTDADISGLSMNYGGIVIGVSSYLVIEHNVIDNATNPVCMFLSNHCIIDDNVLANAPWEGVFVSSSSYIIVSNNTCIGNDEGINLDDSSYAIVSNNTCNNNDDGISLDQSSHTVVSNNTCNGNMEDGIDLDDSSYITVSNNTCNGNENGIYLDSSNNITVIDNSMVGSTVYGISLYASSDNTIVGNTVVDSADYGIYVASSSSNLIYDNALIDNRGATPEFSSSHVQAYDDGTNAWNSTTRGNFWVDWQSSERYLIDGGSMADELPFYIVDSDAPEVTITSPAVGAWYNTTTINVTWTASDASGIANMSISMDGGARVEVTNHYYEFTALAEGQHIVSVRVYDHAGNFQVESKVFNIETALPSIAITEPASDSTVGTTAVQVAWTASSASGIGRYWISVDGGDFVDVGQNTSHLLSLDNGQHTVIVKARDYAGNWNSTEVDFEVVDNVAPTATISPSGDNVAISSVIVVEFSEAMNTSSVSIVVNGIEGTIAWDGNVATFTPSSALAYGTAYTITVTGKDLAGNEMSSESVFTTLEDKGVIRGTIKDADGNAVANATVTLSNGMTATTDENGRFEFTAVPSGSYTMTIAKDGFQTITQTVSTSAGQTTDLATLSIVRTASESDDNGSTLWLFGLVGVVIAAILVIGFLFYQRKKGGKK